MSLSYTLDNSRREYWIEQINSIRTQILRFSLDRIVELNFCNTLIPQHFDLTLFISS